MRKKNYTVITIPNTYILSGLIGITVACASLGCCLLSFGWGFAAVMSAVAFCLAFRTMDLEDEIIEITQPSANPFLSTKEIKLDKFTSSELREELDRRAKTEFSIESLGRQLTIEQNNGLSEQDLQNLFAKLK